MVAALLVGERMADERVRSHEVGTGFRWRCGGNGGKEEQDQGSKLQQGFEHAEDRFDLMRLRQAVAAVLEHIQLDIG